MSLNYYSYIEYLIDESYADLIIFLDASDYVSKTKLESAIIQSNISGRKYLEIFLEEDMLNERDVDLIDIEFNFKIQENSINIEGELYGSDGKVFTKIDCEILKTEILNLKNQLNDFVSAIKDNWSSVIDRYVITH